MCSRYLEYIKDNPQGYWFKAKLYGWGWVPATWQGWAVLLLFVLLMVLDFLRIDAGSHSASDTLVAFVPQTFLLAFLLLLVCYAKGEKPRWQWGLPKEKNDTAPRDTDAP